MQQWRLVWDDSSLMRATRSAERKGVTETAYAALRRSQNIISEKNIIDTGHMQNTMEVHEAKEKGNGFEAEMGNWTADYTIWQEIGTSRLPARPFIAPALEEEAPSLPQRIYRHMTGGLF